jgi:hypothetical protein
LCRVILHTCIQAPQEFMLRPLDRASCTCVHRYICGYYKEVRICISKIDEVKVSYSMIWQ